MSDIIDIVHRVQVGKESEATVARNYNVHQSTVSRHVCKVRKNPELLSELLTRKHVQSADRARLQTTIQAKVDSHEIIDSVAKLTDEVNAPSGTQYH